MPFFKISPDKESKLIDRMKCFNVTEKDFQERFVKGSGKGGQKINKTSSCVVLKHIPTGLTVKCQRERSLSINRFLARRLLVDKIERSITGMISEKDRIIKKKIKQKKKRKKKAQLKSL